MGKSRDRWTVKRSLNAMRPCLEAVEEEQRFLRELAIFLGSDGDEALVRLLDAFHYTSAWPAVRGAFAIHNGEPDGWPTLQRAFRRQALRYLVRFQYHASLKAKGYGTRGKPFPYAAFGHADLNAICLCLLHAIATGEDACATNLGERLVDHLQQPDDLFDRGLFEDTPLESFAVLLFCRWQDVRHDAVEKLLSEPQRFHLLHSDVYRQVLQTWKNNVRFDDAVAEMAVLRSKWTDHEEDPWPIIPYNVIPVEFLALRRIGREQGLQVALPMHPMLQTPWGRPPDGLWSIPNDDLWTQVVARCRRFLPGLTLPPGWE